MELKKDPRCYTDLCLNGKWYHHDHCTNQAYGLKGGGADNIELARVPDTEDELLELLNQAIRIR